MTVFQAHEVRGGAVIKADVALRQAGRMIVPAGTQGVVQRVVYLPAKDTVQFTVKWNVGSDDVFLPVLAKNATLVQKAEDVCA